MPGAKNTKTERFGIDQERLSQHTSPAGVASDRLPGVCHAGWAIALWRRTAHGKLSRLAVKGGLHKPWLGQEPRRTGVGTLARIEHNVVRVLVGSSGIVESRRADPRQHAQDLAPDRQSQVRENNRIERG